MRDQRQRVDFDERIKLSKCLAESKEWENLRELDKKYRESFGQDHGIDFCDGWYFDCYEQKCGHWEVLQSPIYEGMTADDVKKEMIKESKERKCTKCICG